LESKEITSYRGKTFLYLLLSLAFVAFAIFHLRTSDKDLFMSWLCLIFFGLGVLVFLWLLIRPQRLLLDPEGFTVAGGMVRTPRKIYWRDVSEFLVFPLPRGGTMVGFKFVPGAGKQSAIGSFARRFDVDGALPRSWPYSTNDMVDQLNDYRMRALNAAQSTGSTR
jgi:hypothetical protein